ncbi:hypothetical protein TrCOL_g2461 [Triparma columacea]|uniref:Uncharacterized protein n=1 Tax=Triparma columacea TaxID=722753 RepID=A0A9W7GFY1_9STRA|nr:hypothetical protein TrCOL_g2461 [Triparma columacea]
MTTPPSLPPNPPAPIYKPPAPIYGVPVPVLSSLSSDAPGHSSSSSLVKCWKCHGSGVLNLKRPAPNTSRKLPPGEPLPPCTACKGMGGFPPKVLKKVAGTIKKTSTGETVTIPPPRSHHPTDVTYASHLSSPSSLCDSVAFELPISGPAVLSNFMGSWRLLQEEKGGHRYTTDDICTAYVAFKSSLSTPLPNTLHLDLGTGAGSVLMAVRWLNLSRRDKNEHSSSTNKREQEHRSLGLEARSNALSYARFSATYNLGPNPSISFSRGDFRDLSFVQSSISTAWGVGSKPGMVTGTPPYFTVEHDEIEGSTDIKQGGMPSNLQSAPARCEFRGGVNDYVRTGMRVVEEGGVVVVCVNWGNRKRVYEATEREGGRVVECWGFKGKRGKPLLFGVWVIKKGAAGKGDEEVYKEVEVRDEEGNWTEDYTEIMEECGFPTIKGEKGR